MNPTSFTPHTENKDIHYQMLSDAFPAIQAQNTAQQNLGQYKPVEAPKIDFNKVFDDFCKTFYDSIMGSFQMRLWGYIPESEVRGIISRSDATYTYKFVSDGAKSFVEINWDKKTYRTEYFNANVQ